MICEGRIEAEARIAAIAGDPPSEEAVKVMRTAYENGHLGKCAPGAGTCIVGLRLRRRAGPDCHRQDQGLGIVPADKLVGWDIEDPDQPVSAYEEAARKIDSCLQHSPPSAGLKCTRKAAFDHIELVFFPVPSPRFDLAVEDILQGRPLVAVEDAAGAMGISELEWP